MSYKTVAWLRGDDKAPHVITVHWMRPDEPHMSLCGVDTTKELSDFLKKGNHRFEATTKLDLTCQRCKRTADKMAEEASKPKAEKKAEKKAAGAAKAPAKAKAEAKVTHIAKAKAAKGKKAPAKGKEGKAKAS